jgi:GAF domain-containing protein
MSAEIEALRRSLAEVLEQQAATGAILRVIADSLTDLQPVLEAVAESAARLCDATDAHVWRANGDIVQRAASYGRIPIALDGRRPLDRESVAARAILERQPIHVEDLAAVVETEFPAHREAQRRTGARSVLAIPLMRDGISIGPIVIRCTEVQPFTNKQIALLKTFADRAVIAIENVRLFKELEAANRELAAASQHKSEFLANMSHELRTPLNAVIGFSDAPRGQHLLSLINDILDLSKIEAGRMELEVSGFDLPATIDNALVLVRERAGRRGISLETSIDGRVGQVQADERKLRQVSSSRSGPPRGRSRARGLDWLCGHKEREAFEAMARERVAALLVAPDRYQAYSAHGSNTSSPRAVSRPPPRATHEVRARHQSQDRQGPRPHDPSVVAGAGGSGDRIDGPPPLPADLADRGGRRAAAAEGLASNGPRNLATAW